MTANGFVEIADVRLHFGGSEGTLAVDHLNMSVGAGELTAVVGPSGCGKSSLMKLVAGLMPPTSGTIRVDGATGDAAAESRRHGFPESDSVALAHYARKPPAAAANRSPLSFAISMPIVRRMRRMRNGCWTVSACAALRIGFHGNCPAECSSALLFAGHSFTSLRC